MNRVPLLKVVAILVALVGLAANAIGAQSRQTPHTLRLDDPDARPEATLADIQWLAGTWEGHAFGGVVEEVWTEPSGGTMMGVFKILMDGAPSLYETEWIVEEAGSLVLKLKHFNADLTPWEDKDEFVSFPLVSVGEDSVYFDGLTYQLERPGCLRVWVVLHQDGRVREEELRFRRMGAGPQQAGPC